MYILKEAHLRSPNLQPFQSNFLMLIHLANVPPNYNLLLLGLPRFNTLMYGGIVAIYIGINDFFLAFVAKLPCP